MKYINYINKHLSILIDKAGNEVDLGKRNKLLSKIIRFREILNFHDAVFMDVN